MRREQRSGNLAEIALEDGARRTALARGIAVEPAGTPAQATTAIGVAIANAGQETGVRGSCVSVALKETMCPVFRADWAFISATI
jgi:hypothetical protein